jgi:hypothetical protein
MPSETSVESTQPVPRRSRLNRILQLTVYSILGLMGVALYALIATMAGFWGTVLFTGALILIFVRDTGGWSKTLARLSTPPRHHISQETRQVTEEVKEPEQESTQRDKAASQVSRRLRGMSQELADLKASIAELRTEYSSVTERTLSVTSDIGRQLARVREQLEEERAARAAMDVRLKNMEEQSGGEPSQSFHGISLREESPGLADVRALRAAVMDLQRPAREMPAALSPLIDDIAERFHVQWTLEQPEFATPRIFLSERERLLRRLGFPASSLYRFLIEDPSHSLLWHSDDPASPTRMLDLPIVYVYVRLREHEREPEIALMRADPTSGGVEYFDRRTGTWQPLGESRKR